MEEDFRLNSSKSMNKQVNKKTFLETVLQSQVFKISI